MISHRQADYDDYLETIPEEYMLLKFYKSRRLPMTGEYWIDLVELKLDVDAKIFEDMKTLIRYKVGNSFESVQESKDWVMGDLDEELRKYSIKVVGGPVFVGEGVYKYGLTEVR